MVIMDVATILREIHINMKSCSYFKIENSKVDSLVETTNQGSYHCFQFTRLNYQTKYDGNTMNKSKSQLIDYLHLGFAFITCIYFQDQLVGTILLLPQHISIIEAVNKDFKAIGVKPFAGPHRPHGIASKLLYPNMNIWIQNGQVVQEQKNKFLLKIQQCLTNSTTTYTLNDIQNMVSPTVLKEANYIKYLFDLLPTQNLYGERIYLEKRDVVVKEKDSSISVGVQLKLATFDAGRKTQYSLFQRSGPLRREIQYH